MSTSVAGSQELSGCFEDYRALYLLPRIVLLFTSAAFVDDNERVSRQGYGHACSKVLSSGVCYLVEYCSSL